MARNLTTVKVRNIMLFILRHRPEQYGLVLDNNHSCTIGELLDSLTKFNKWKHLTALHIRQIVQVYYTDTFTIEDERIQANEGHTYLNKEDNVMHFATDPDSHLTHGIKCEETTNE